MLGTELQERVATEGFSMEVTFDKGLNEMRD